MKVTREMISNWKNNQRIAKFFTKKDRTEIEAIGIEYFEHFDEGYWRRTLQEEVKQFNSDHCYRLCPSFHFQFEAVPRRFAVTTKSFDNRGDAYFVSELEVYLADVEGFVGYIGIEYKESPNNVYKSHQWENQARMSNPAHINTADIDNIRTLTPAFIWMWSTK